MFGCQAAYLHGRLVLVLAAKEEPWNGLMVCTSREYHSALVAEYPGLQPHPVLPKWLYLTQSSNEFEEMAQQIVVQTLKNDRRIGVEPGGGKRKQPSSSSIKKRGADRKTFD